MCGRFTRTTAVMDVAKSFETAKTNVVLAPSYNISPSQRIVAVRQASDERVVFTPIWGFTAEWNRSGASMVINARVESVREKPLFRDLVKSQRCVIPVSGYYEWVSEISTLELLGYPKGKVPFYVTLGTAQVDHTALLSVAGLWRTDNGVDRAVLLTTEAVGALEHIHHRMPVLLTASDIPQWLSREEDVDWGALSIPNTENLVSYRVDSTVNAARNDHPDLIGPYKGDTQARLF